MKRAFAALAAVLCLAACSKASGIPDTAQSRAQVVAFLAAHPETIQAGIDAYNAKQSAAAIGPRRAALEHDARDYVANPGGKVTVVEFFDYRCPYCKAGLGDVENLIAANKDVRFVFKELPILPDGDGQVGVSLRASEAALAAGRAGKYEAVHHAMMAAKPLDDAGIIRALADNGLPTAVVSNPQDAQHLDDNRDLARAIRANGTPSFVVGDTLVEGNRMDQLIAAIAEARRTAKG